MSSLNDKKANCISFDMIFDVRSKTYQTYVIMKEGDDAKIQLVEMNFEADLGKPTSLIYPNLFDLYDNNCGDKIRATQMLLIVVCTKTGAINIFRREDKVILVNESNYKFSKDSDIAVIEHNIDIAKINSQKLYKSET